MAVKPKLAMIPSGYKGGASSGDLYSVLPSDGTGDFDFSRSGSATRINKDGLIETVSSNVPRLNYPLIDGKVSGCPSLLLENSATNLISYSEELNTTWLTFRSSVTANDIVSPDGSQNAEKIIQQSGQPSSGGVYQIFTLSNSTVYTYSVFLKSGGYDFGLMRIDGGQYAWFDLSLGVVGSISGSGSSSIEDFGNGWFRCSFTITTTSTTGEPHIYIANSDGSQTLSGADGVKGIYAWGAMLEQGYATSYIPTTTSAVTRSAETCNNSGDVNTFNDSEGVLMAEISALANDLNIEGISVSDGSNSNRVVIFKWNVSNTIRVRVGSSGTNYVNENLTLSDVTDVIKIAVKYKVNDYALWLNGVEVATSSSSEQPSGMNVLSFTNPTEAQDFYGNTKGLQVFDKALSDYQLKQLTTI